MTVQYNPWAVAGCVAEVTNAYGAFSLCLYADPDALGLPSDCTQPSPANPLTSSTACPISFPSPLFPNYSDPPSLTLSGTVNITVATAGTAALFRLFVANSSTCFAQGVVTGDGGGGDLVISSITLNAGDIVSLTSLTIGPFTATSS